MGDEAKNTDRRANGWGSTPLRTQAISFVSAGPLKREEDAWNTVSEDDSPMKQSDAEATRDASPMPAKQLDSTSEPVNDPTLSTVPATDEAIPVDPAKTADPPPALHSQIVEPSSVPTFDAPASNSESESEEEILFAGRSSSRQPSGRTVPIFAESDKEPVPPSTSARIAGDSLLPQASNTKPMTDDSIARPAPSEATPVGKPPKKSPQFHASLFQRSQDAMMQDYIENMALDDSEEGDDAEPGSTPVAGRKKFKKTQTFRMFNGDGLENAKVQTTPRGTPSSRIPLHIPDQAFDWDSDDLADFDDISTTDEEVDDIGQVIRHRERPNGAQYLVIATGGDASDAKWMLRSRLVSESAVKEISIYEEIRAMDIEEDDYDEDDDEDEDEETNEDAEEAIQDLVGDIESEDDENARIMDYTTRMTDEQIARALAKQEELGLGGDELMLFDGEAPDHDIEDVFGAGDDFIPFNLGKHTSNRGRSKRNRKQRDSFPSAEAFADALDQDPYGAFDIMDFDRPSLKPKKKGRKSDFPWDIGDLDEELRDQLVNTWTKDREKKAERKRQKEEARLQASLDAEDGSDPAMIKARIRQFLVQDVTELRLSPMEAAIRAAVHRLAKALKLNSRSEGKEGIGIGRYPVLTKTARTLRYDFDTIYQVDALMNTRRFFPKHLTTGLKTPRAMRNGGMARSRRAGGGGGIMGGATYRDGEIVGASAPEIGIDNKGRAMLEKMGWTVGMGIGAEGNKGAIDHVRHVVKTTKAGLG